MIMRRHAGGSVSVWRRAAFGSVVLFDDCLPVDPQGGLPPAATQDAAVGSGGGRGGGVGVGVWCAVVWPLPPVAAAAVDVGGLSQVEVEVVSCTPVAGGHQPAAVSGVSSQLGLGGLVRVAAVPLLSSLALGDVVEVEVDGPHLSAVCCRRRSGRVGLRLVVPPDASGVQVRMLRQLLGVVDGRWWSSGRLVVMSVAADHVAVVGRHLTRFGWWFDQQPH